jgi:1,4-dihydroxy-2-naphthoate octaprenyltransferase
MNIKDIVILFRFPFSFFLMPVFFYAISNTNEIDVNNCVLMFFALHVFLFPASNAYNSYMDQDTESIGGVEKPPMSDKKLFYASLLFDVIGLSLCYLVSIYFMLGMLIYTLVSRAYSWHGIRIKKYPIWSFLSVVVFQGIWIYFFVLNFSGQQSYHLPDISEIDLIYAGLICSLNLAAMYPITQVFQHKQDAEQGVMTLSRLLGIKGTFYFSSAIFPMIALFSFLYFKELNFFPAFLFWLTMNAPVMVYFFYWMIQVLKDEKQANYQHCMRLNLLASISMNIFYMGLFYYHQSL